MSWDPATIEAARQYHRERDAKRRAAREAYRQEWLEQARAAIRQHAPSFPLCGAPGSLAPLCSRAASVLIRILTLWLSVLIWSRRVRFGGSWNRRCGAMWMCAPMLGQLSRQ
jgi:hypothetical protein